MSTDFVSSLLNLAQLLISHEIYLATLDRTVEWLTKQNLLINVKTLVIIKLVSVSTVGAKVQASL